MDQSMVSGPRMCSASLTQCMPTLAKHMFHCSNGNAWNIGYHTYSVGVRACFSMDRTLCCKPEGTGFHTYTVAVRACGSMVQALGYKPEGCQFQVLMRSLNCFNLPNPSSRTRPWGLLSLLTEMSTGSRKVMFLGSRVYRADNLTTICEPIV
jgi:hypothetical protein